MTKHVWRSLRAAGALGAISLLSDCSSVGPGLAHHPVDCAVGIPWADCLEGTPGYNNGGGQQTRAEATKQQNDLIAAQQHGDAAQCISDMQSSDLDPIRDKVELSRTSTDTPPPFQIASNDTFPTPSERQVIAKWATIRDECIKRANATSHIPPSATPLQIAFLQQDRAFSVEVTGRVGELILALYQARLTYGEFAQKRYEIGRDGAAAERQFRTATLIADHDRQVQAQQLAQQQFQNNLIAWSTYMQAVNARQPQTVHLEGSVRVKTNCTSQQLGTFVSTDCY
jgi:hypothetical protein